MAAACSLAHPSVLVLAPSSHSPLLEAAVTLAEEVTAVAVRSRHAEGQDDVVAASSRAA